MDTDAVSVWFGVGVVGVVVVGVVVVVGGGGGATVLAGERLGHFVNPKGWLWFGSFVGLKLPRLQLLFLFLVLLLLFLFLLLELMMMISVFLLEMGQHDEAAVPSRS